MLRSSGVVYFSRGVILTCSSDTLSKEQWRMREILRLHRELDLTCRDLGGRHFVSGWQTHNPFANEIVQKFSDTSRADYQGYRFLSDSDSLKCLIRNFHKHTEQYDPSGVFITIGSSPLMLTVIFALKELGFLSARFLPPIYHTLYYFADAVGLGMEQVNSVLWRDSAILDLPEDQKTALFLSDPAWIFGESLTVDQIEFLRNWQQRTGSLIIVDSTFGYSNWSGSLAGELSARLDPENTIRIICPTKSLAVHGVRLAYALLPHRLYENFRFPCSNTTGATSGTDTVNGTCLMDALASQTNNRKLFSHAKSQLELLLSSGALTEVIGNPSTSYFVFGHLHPKIQGHCVKMDGRYFNVETPKEFCRVNLLYPNLEQLIDMVS